MALKNRIKIIEKKLDIKSEPDPPIILGITYVDEDKNGNIIKADVLDYEIECKDKNGNVWMIQRYFKFPDD